MPLSEHNIDAAAPRARPYKMADGGGMYIQVMPTGAKYWHLKYRVGGREKKISFGVYPDVTIAEARSHLAQARQLLADGIDPSQQRKKQLAVERAEYARQQAATRFSLDSDGALTVSLGGKILPMTPAETADLRAFLQATRSVTPKVDKCL